MASTAAYAAVSRTSGLAPFSVTRRALRPNDVAIDILFCGVCHTDVHQVRNEWKDSAYPMVPGHEIVGKVTHVGAASVTKFKVGDAVGVGFMVGACRACEACVDGLEQFCTKGYVQTFNGREDGEAEPTYGGYSQRIVVDAYFVLRLPPNLDLARVAPLLCAGITTYSPLRHWKVGPGQHVGIVGLGGLGHVAVKLARAMGADVTVFTTSAAKRDSALALGATKVVVSKDAVAMKAEQGQYQFVLDTVSAAHDLALGLLHRDGALVLVGVPEHPLSVASSSLVFGRKSIGGSLVGGIPETQEMLDFCGQHNIMADVEVIPMQKINEAYERMLVSDVHYRFVIDMKSLRPE